MADFSIEGDITPLRGRHFSSTLTSGEVSALEAEEMAGTMNYFNNMSKVIKAMDDKRNKDLQYQMDLEKLQRSREDAQRRRDEEARLGQLTGALQGLTSADQSPEEQRAALAEFRLNNADLFKSAGAKQLYDAANSKVTADAAIQAKEVAKAEKDIRKNMLLYGNNLEKLESEFIKDGYTDQEREAFEIAKYKIEEGQKQKRAQQEFARASGKVSEIGKRIESTDKLFEDIVSDADVAMAEKLEKGEVTKGTTDIGQSMLFHIGSGSNSAAKNIRKLKVALARQEGQRLSGIEDYLKEQNLDTPQKILARVEDNNEREREQYEQYQLQIDYGQIPTRPQPQSPQQNNTGNSETYSLFNP